jgi:hypothetical protein
VSPNWSAFNLCLTPKDRHPKQIPYFRGITVCDTLAKWYSAALTSGLDRWIRRAFRQQWHEVQLFAYEYATGCEQLISALQILYLKGVEWSNNMPIYIYLPI